MIIQIGRSFDDHIDFVINEPRILLSESTHLSNQAGNDDTQFQLVSNCAPKQINCESSVSRFACRIHVQRDPPYVARLYAAGFDFSNNIFLGVNHLSYIFTFVFFYLIFCIIIISLVRYMTSN